jgi:hypothetical protein
MAKETESGSASHPKQKIRRFDIFAEFSRQERQAKGYKAAEAKGYGIWLAKVVAAKKFGRMKGDDGSPGSGKAKRPGPEPTFRSLNDEKQTDETFQHEIVDRMGKTFYSKTFRKAIIAARKAGKSYEDIRDELRKDWKPAKESHNARLSK